LSSSLIRQDLLPMVVGYVLVMASLAAGLVILHRTGRKAASGGPKEPGAAASPATAAGTKPTRRGWLRLIRHVVTTSVGGYLVLMTVVIAYYYGLVRVSGNFIENAFTGCALLLALCDPVFLAASWLTERWQESRAARKSHARRTLPPLPADKEPIRNWRTLR
jgi:Family of unknown function (DUF6256)